MADKTLVLRLDAPLQSWGVQAKGTVKTTQAEPSFSGVLGLAANAMGWNRDADLSELTALRFGSRTDRSGQLTRDFFTAGTTTGVAKRAEIVKDGVRTFKDTLDGSGVIGTKFYLAGAVFTVALQGDPEVLEKLVRAFDAPARTLYLGRKSCPLSRTPVLGIVDGSVEEALRTTPLDESLVPIHIPHYLGVQADLFADEMIKMTVPALPTAMGAMLRQDCPTSFASIHRNYEGRYVKSEFIPREDLYPNSMKGEVA